MSDTIKLTLALFALFCLGMVVGGAVGEWACEWLDGRLNHAPRA